jgi:phosphoribosylanthranilate isomerase
MDVKVKICGLTNLVDTQAALAVGADVLGFIFFPKSPRYVEPERVREILGALNPDRRVVLTVGVFVNESIEAIAQILDFCGLDLAQLHGEEPPSMLSLDDGSAGESADRDPSPLRGRAYKAVRPRSAEEAAALADQYALPASARRGGQLPALLLDAYHPQLRGGTGQTGDWRLAVPLAAQYPLLLAGGLNPSNVAEAVRSVRPWGVDVASGVEKSPGQKDHAAMEALLRAVRDTTY